MVNKIKFIATGEPFPNWMPHHLGQEERFGADPMTHEEYLGALEADPEVMRQVLPIKAKELSRSDALTLKAFGRFLQIAGPPTGPGGLFAEIRQAKDEGELV